jgi:hypothetical protein
VTESEWLTCDDPVRMLAFLGPRASDRKHRPHLCAGCRQMWHMLYDDGSRMAVEVAERYADGNATERDLKDADWHAEPAGWMQFLDTPSLRFFGPEQTLPPEIRRLVDMGVLTEEAYRSGAERIEVADPEALSRVGLAASLAERCISFGFELDGWVYRHLGQEWVGHVGWPGGSLIRDLFANPFRPVAFDPRWRTSDVVGLARAIYDDRAFDRLPILADALMDAGCDDEQILAHCRSDGPHVRGCWVVDLVLGKE